MSQSEPQFIEINPDHIPDLEAAPIRFVVCEDFPGFIAEAAIVGSDFVFHFYLPKSGVEDYDWYWTRFFPEALDKVAQAHFNATTPRLKAMHVNELGIDSWWLRAYGFATSVIDPDAFVQRFYQKMDEALRVRK